MNSTFSPLDWSVFVGYFLLLIGSSVLLSRAKVRSSRDYFVAGNAMPTLAVAISVLATAQSAATFLGGPEFAYRNDMTLLGFFVSGMLGALFVAKVLIPRFYAIKAVTVYELLQTRYGERAKREAGAMFLVGRLFASGARLYIGALAISMILFSDIAASHVAVAIAVLMAGALAYTYVGGVRSIIFSDVIQAVTYIGAAVAVLIYLYGSFHADFGTLVATLQSGEKLRLLDFSFSGEFSVWSLLGGWLLLNIAVYGMDQDMSQRVLSCKDHHEGSRSLIRAIWLSLPVTLLFLAIGALLYLYYHHPELSSFADGGVEQRFAGEKITIFMTYILNEMPEGMRGLVTVGAIAAALSSTTSVLGAMASVAVEDFYRPWRSARSDTDEAHYVKAARAAVILFALLLSVMAMVSYYWQRTTDLPLLSFALGVMAFAYSGLLGVYFSAIFTKRGSRRTVPLALLGGFMTVLLLQPYILNQLVDWQIGFSWQLVIGTVVSFFIMQTGRSEA
jgi:SSS family solute:Na+ symporter